MKFTHSWLKEHLDTQHPAPVLADKLTWLGVEVEALHDPAAALAPFIIAEIEKAEQHPNADRLKVCVVNTGTQKLQVVCGAPNARAGLKGVFAPPDSVIPTSGMKLKVTKIRDVESNGMMCSARELGLGEDHEGIIELPADAPLGKKFAEYRKLDDPLYEVKLTPNRPDCNGVLGIARDLAAANMGSLKPMNIAPVKGAFKSPVNVTLDFDAAHKDACPYFIGRFIKGVKNGPSPDWLQGKLKAIGLKPISALVDITNYLTFDCARPLHVFDAAKVKGNIHARMAKSGEKLMALNGKEYTLTGSMTVIADDQRALGIAGIIGGEESGCSEATTDIFLECATFDPVRTARTGRALQVISDARYRFERGVDPAFMLQAAELATKLIIDLCGGTASELVIAGAEPAWQRSINLRADRCKNFGGLDVPVGEQEKLLKAVGCAVKIKGNVLEVTPPSWRPDMGGSEGSRGAQNGPQHEGEADCVEEILRLKSYESIPPVSLPADKTLKQVSGLGPAQQRREITRRTLAARGLLEVVSFSFMPAKLAEMFGGGVAELKLQNPISAELDVMRPGILPNLLLAAKANAARGAPDVALFEVGPVYAAASENGQALHASGLHFGMAQPRHWAAKARAADLYDAKADALAALEAAGVPIQGVQASSGAAAWYHPGRSGTLRLGGTVLAQFGEIHPGILQSMDIKSPAAAFEVFLSALPPVKEAGAARPPLVLSDLQPVTRDFAFILDKNVEASTLLRAVKGAERELIKSVEVFDVYEGKGVPEGQKSLALEVVIQPRDKTLTEPELAALSEKIAAAALKATGAVLRK
jgi:phenylalanyl-tRNA synthetase beta chain